MVEVLQQSELRVSGHPPVKVAGATDIWHPSAVGTPSLPPYLCGLHLRPYPSVPTPALSLHPKNREIRAPFVDELLPHRNEIDPKYTYLLRATPTDPEGNRSTPTPCPGRPVSGHFSPFSVPF